MSLLTDMLAGVRTVVMLGHIRPDGDCVGSCLGLYNYLKQNIKGLEVDLFLQPPPEKFGYLKGFDQIDHRTDLEKDWDLCITVDSSDKERLGAFIPYFDRAQKTWCIDHHVTNQGFADQNYVLPKASSSGEVVYSLLEPELIDRWVAECLYTGIIHDTGVFKYNSTSRTTMEIAGRLIEKGVDSATIIDDSFYRRTYAQNRILGKALLESVLLLDGACIYTSLSQRDMDLFHVTAKDLDLVIDQLRVTQGVECAIFLYEVEPGQYKISLRANQKLDVSQIAGYFGGGGHVKAAGCTMTGTVSEIVQALSHHISRQLKECTCQTE